MGEIHSIGEAFKAFPKIARLARECIVTEKLDGTNAQVCVVPIGENWRVSNDVSMAGTNTHNPNYVALVDGLAIYAGSRTRWLQPGKATDNFGFAGWVKDNAEELVKLGPGRHYGEWWGKGIQRNYGLSERRFSLFNTERWRQHDTGPCNPDLEPAPTCCHVVPVLYSGNFDTPNIDMRLQWLRDRGSFAAPGFDKPEGIIVYHSAANVMFKRTLEDDEVPKALAAAKVAA